MRYKEHRCRRQTQSAGLGHGRDMTQMGVTTKLVEIVCDCIKITEPSVRTLAWHSGKLRIAPYASPIFTDLLVPSSRSVQRF